ncbi:MAG TPA: hypothetical protein VGC14_12065 [Rhizobium sp.]
MLIGIEALAASQPDMPERIPQRRAGIETPKIWVTSVAKEKPVRQPNAHFLIHSIA